MKTSRLLVLGVLLSLAACSGEWSIGTTTTTPPPAETSTISSANPSGRPDLTGLSGEQLSAKAQAALRAAKSIRISATDEDGALGMDLRFGRTGSTAMVVSDEGDRIQLLSLGNAAYIKAPDSFWRSAGGKDGDAAGARLSGKWLKGKLTDSNFTQFAMFLRFKDFITGPLADLWPKPPARAGMQTVDKTECIGLVGAGVTVWVDKYTARPVTLDGGTGSNHEFTYTFSQYDAVQEPKPPRFVVVDG